MCISSLSVICYVLVCMCKAMVLSPAFLSDFLQILRRPACSSEFVVVAVAVIVLAVLICLYPALWLLEMSNLLCLGSCGPLCPACHHPAILARWVGDESDEISLSWYSWVCPNRGCSLNKRLL